MFEIWMEFMQDMNCSCSSYLQHAVSASAQLTSTQSGSLLNDGMANRPTFQIRGQAVKSNCPRKHQKRL